MAKVGARVGVRHTILELVDWCGDGLSRVVWGWGGVVWGRGASRSGRGGGSQGGDEDLRILGKGW